MAALLRGGALPVDLEILSQRTAGPTLRRRLATNKSIQAMGIGFIILFAFMIIYFYRVPGILGLHFTGCLLTYTVMGTESY